MRLAAAAGVAFTLAGCAAAPQDPAGRAAAPAVSMSPRPAAVAPTPALTLRNPSFETDLLADRPCPVGWYCTMHSDPNAFRFFLQGNAAAGERSLCVERVANEPWVLVTQGFDSPALQGARLRLSMAVLLEGVSGEGAGPWALVEGKPPANPRKLLRGTAGWQRVAIDISVPASGRAVEVGATLEGPGKACFDDVRLEFVAPG